MIVLNASMAVSWLLHEPGFPASELQGLEVSIEPPPQLDRISELIEFAEGQGLTLYDAAYVHLTMTSNSTLATLDKAMRQAADWLRLNILPL